jgi:diguanylate cyclase (GGDEF)-like protein
VQGEFLGLLCLVGGAAGSGEPRLGRRDLALNFGQTIKLSLHNLRLQEKLREQAIRDPLTGLYNRRFLEDNLDRELHRSKRQETPLGIVMLDLDHFKHFNDAFGHEAGDLILTRVGKVLQTVLRKSDIACRYGGEEFVLVFPESSLDDTRRRVEEIRSLVRDMEIWHGQRRLGTVTMSAGLAMAPGNGSTARALIAAADDAMYVAKHDGRDRLVCCALAAAGTSTALIALEEPNAAGYRDAPRILKITDPPRGAKRPPAGGPGRGESEEA